MTHRHKQKTPSSTGFCESVCDASLLHGDYADVAALLGPFPFKTNFPISGRKQCVVATQTDVRPRVEMCPALAYQDIACFHRLAAKTLDAESFAF